MNTGEVFKIVKLTFLMGGVLFAPYYYFENRDKVLKLEETAYDKVFKMDKDGFNKHIENEKKQMAAKLKESED